MKIWDQFKSKSLTKQIFLMVSIVFIVFFLVYNSLMIYTKHNRYIEVPDQHQYQKQNAHEDLVQKFLWSYLFPLPKIRLKAEFIGIFCPGRIFSPSYRTSNTISFPILST